MFMQGSNVKKEERQSAPAMLYTQPDNPTIISSSSQQPLQHIQQVPPSPKASQEYSNIRKRRLEDTSSSLYDHKDDSKGSEVWLPISVSHESPASTTQTPPSGPWTITQTRSSLIPDPAGSPLELIKQHQHHHQHQHQHHQHQHQHQQQLQEHSSEDKAHRLPSIKHLHLEPSSSRARPHWEYFASPSPTSFATPAYSPSHRRSPLGVTQTITPPSVQGLPHPPPAQSHSRPSSPSTVNLKEQLTPTKPTTVGFIETTFTGTPQKKVTHKRRPANVDKGSLYCHTCGTRNTPEWRRGPQGPATLCNACGLAYAKRLRQEEERAAAAATPRIEHHPPTYDPPVPPPPPAPLYAYPHLDTYEQVASYLHAPPPQAYPVYAFTPPSYEQLPAAYGYNLKAVVPTQITHSQPPHPLTQVSHSQVPSHLQVSHTQTPHSSTPSSSSSASRTQLRSVQRFTGHTFHQYFPPSSRTPGYVNFSDTTGTLVPISPSSSSPSTGNESDIPILSLSSSVTPYSLSTFSADTSASS